MNTISENLVAFRAKRGNTQDELAKYLNVSTQAVSEWESGEAQPQIEYLEDIAEFYQTSVDKLLGTDEERKRIRIEQFHKDANRACESKNYGKAVDIWREANHEYLCDTYCASQLIFALNDLFNSNNNIDCLDEIIRTGRQIVAQQKSESLMGRVIHVLCSSLAKAGMLDEAKEYAKLAYNIDDSYEAILSEICAEEINGDNIDAIPESDVFVRKVMDRINALNSILHKYC